jgi:hypothetical protein
VKTGWGEEFLLNTEDVESDGQKKEKWEFYKK